MMNSDICQLRLQVQTFQTPALAAFDIKVDASSCFPELLLAVATVDVACRYCTLATGAGKGEYITIAVAQTLAKPGVV